MKFTKRQIKQIIREELSRMMEAEDGEQIMQAIMDVPKAAQVISDKLRKEIESIVEPSGLDPVVMATVVGAIITQGNDKILRAITELPSVAQSLSEKTTDEIEQLAEPSGLDPVVLAQAVAALISAK